MFYKLLSVLFLIGLLSFNFVQEPNQSAENIKEKGDKITQESGGFLSKAVMNAMAKGGVEYAANFCHANAYPLTDSLAKNHKVSIKRTSLRLRNPTNAPTKLERKLLLTYEKDKKSGKELTSRVVEQKHEWVYVRPILLQPQCQTCHGKVGETLTVENNEIIKKLYPKDKAVGFSAGDLRGMWVVKFSKL